MRNQAPQWHDGQPGQIIQLDLASRAMPPRILPPITDACYPHPGPLSNELRYPGHGLPPRPGEAMSAKTAWARLCRGAAIGKSSVLLYDAANDERQPATVDMLSIEGDDEDATQMILTLAPPQVCALPLVDVIAIGQNTTGSQNSAQMRQLGNFPGSADPMEWPPLEAIVEWGTGGTSARAVVDFMNGALLNVSASWVRVFAAVSRSTRNGVIGTSAAYVLGAFASPGYTSAGTAQRTIYIGDLDNAEESGVFTVPRFAKRAYVISADGDVDPSITTASLRFWQSPDGVAGGNCVGNYYQAGNQPLGFPIPAAGAYFSVLSGMTDTTRFSVLFDLSL